MFFNPGLRIGAVIHNEDIVRIFQCGNMGGMRRSHKTNSLVLISDYTKDLYYDCWVGDIMHYTGMGKKGHQTITGTQNRTLAESNENNVAVFLFEVFDEGCYTYCGQVKLINAPYQGVQKDIDGKPRVVWIFPIKPVHTFNFYKPANYTYASFLDLQKSSNAIDIAHVKDFEKEISSQNDHSSPKTSSSPQKIKVDSKSSISGKTILHKSYGKGIVRTLKNGIITVQFDNGMERQLNYKLCVDNRIIEILDK